MWSRPSIEMPLGLVSHQGKAGFQDKDLSAVYNNRVQLLGRLKGKLDNAACLEMIDRNPNHTLSRCVDLDAQQRATKSITTMTDRFRRDLQMIGIVFDRLSNDLESIVGPDVVFEQPEAIIELHGLCKGRREIHCAERACSSRLMRSEDVERDVRYCRIHGPSRPKASADRLVSPKIVRVDKASRLSMTSLSKSCP